jgi:hypothetical protein
VLIKNVVFYAAALEDEKPLRRRCILQLNAGSGIFDAFKCIGCNFKDQVRREQLTQFAF